MYIYERERERERESNLGDGFVTSKAQIGNQNMMASTEDETKCSAFFKNYLPGKKKIVLIGSSKARVS